MEIKNDNSEESALEEYNKIMKMVNYYSNKPSSFTESEEETIEHKKLRETRRKKRIQTRKVKKTNRFNSKRK